MGKNVLPTSYFAIFCPLRICPLRLWVFVKSGNGSSYGSGGGSGSGSNDGTEALKRKQKRNGNVNTEAKPVRKCSNGSKNGSKNGTEVPIKRDIECISMKTPKTEFDMTGSPRPHRRQTQLKKYLCKLHRVCKRILSWSSCKKY